MDCRGARVAARGPVKRCSQLSRAESVWPCTKVVAEELQGSSWFGVYFRGGASRLLMMWWGGCARKGEESWQTEWWPPKDVHILIPETVNMVPYVVVKGGSDHQILMCGGGFPKQQAVLRTPAGYLRLQLSSDIIYLELVSDPTS